MSWWFPEFNSPEYQETLETIRRSKIRRGAFGYFTTRKKTTYTWNEWVVRNWLIDHGITDFIHNYTVLGEVPEGLGLRELWGTQVERRYEFDFYIPSLGVAIEVDPPFHYQASHPATRDVMRKDKEKDIWAESHGIQLIRVIAYTHPRKFLEEVERKLRPLLY